jgi:hypothetical protein
MLCEVFSSLLVFSEGCRSVDPTISWRASRRLLPKRKPHRAVAVVVAVTPLVDTVVHLPVAVDARSYVEELWELEAGCRSTATAAQGLRS